MKKQNYWESIVSVIIWVMILTIVIVWIRWITSYSKELIMTYEDKSSINILESNLYNVLYKVNTSGIQNWETFYLYRNSITKQFEVFTWATNIGYQYVDENWIKVDDIDNTESNIFSRNVLIEWTYFTPFWDKQVFKVNVEKYVKK